MMIVTYVAQCSRVLVCRSAYSLPSLVTRIAVPTLDGLVRRSLRMNETQNNGTHMDPLEIA